MVTTNDKSATRDAAPPAGVPLRVVGEMAVGQPDRTRGRLGLSPASRGSSAGADTSGGGGVMGQAIDSPTDPRWVLAIRTASELEGSILRPERRERLVRTGKVMGLSAFDCNLIIAIVQDQARRGYEPQYCPTAGEAQLRLVPLPRGARLRERFRGRRLAFIGITVAGIIAMEVGVLVWLLR